MRVPGHKGIFCNGKANERDMQPRLRSAKTYLTVWLKHKKHISTGKKAMAVAKELLPKYLRNRSEQILELDAK